MRLSLREQWVSLTAIFLAMIVGILVGIALSSDESLRRQMERQNAQFNALMGEASAMRRDMDEAEKRMAAADRLFQEVAPGLLAGRLTGQRVALVYLGMRREPPFGGALLKMLRRGGADVACQILIPADFPQKVQQAGATGLQLPELEEGALGGAENLGPEVARLIARAVSRGGEYTLFDGCERAEVAWAHGDISWPPAFVVVVGQSEEDISIRAEQLDIPFLEELVAERVPVYACESLDSHPSLMHYYQRVGTGTVDNVDTALGQIALVLGMSKNDRGDFGVKDTADRPYPAGL